MRDRLIPVFKVVCLVLGLAMLYQAARLRGSEDPLEDIVIPNPPAEPTKQTSGAASSNSPAPPARPQPMPGGRPNPGQASDIPAPVQARVEKITQSEILGAVVRPQPAALLGIGGDTALIRSPSGQTDWVKEGASLGSLKLIRIGVNRVLIEENGQQRELMIFSGLGSETLLPKGN